MPPPLPNAGAITSSHYDEGGYLKQLHIMEDKLDKLHLQNIDIIALNHKISKKNELLN